MRAMTLGALISLLWLAGAARNVPAQQIITDPLLPENAVRQVSPHVHVIMGFPNIGIVVGDTGTLVVDTGLGARNGALVARAARALSTRGQRLYLTTTHFHPEHASGQDGFPADTLVIRPKVQQMELEAEGPRQWIAVLDRVAPLAPKLIVPDRGGLGCNELIGEERAFLADLEGRALTLKRQGKSAADAGRMIASEFASQYAGWQSLRNVPQAVERAYADAGSR